jgi:hypothetical protein
MVKTLQFSSREFNQDVSRARRAAEEGPVVITDRGEPAFVLMRYTFYRNLTGEAPGIRALLDHPGMEDIEFDPPRLGEGSEKAIFRPADFS